MLQQLEAKLSQIIQDLEKSIANHNFLLGAKVAIDNIIAESKAAAPVVEAVENMMGSESEHQDSPA